MQSYQVVLELQPKTLVYSFGAALFLMSTLSADAMQENREWSEKSYDTLMWEI